MYMTSEDEKNYHALCLWLRDVLSDLPQRKPKVYAAFRNHCPPRPWWQRGGLDVLNGLRWGFRPYVKVASSNWMGCEDVGAPEPQKDGTFVQRRQIKWYGLTGQYIHLAPDLVMQAGSNPETDLVLEATMLHELIHWNMREAGEDVDEAPSEAFEIEAYGKRIFRTWNICIPSVEVK
jgi:hypothetical protein